MNMASDDTGASVRRRLLVLAPERGDDFQTVLNRYGAERLLYRLCRSPHANRYVLKGATLFSLWMQAHYRPTRDLGFDGKILGDALEATFARRKTALPAAPLVALTVSFSDDETKRRQWAAFLSKGVVSGTQPSLHDVVTMISDFLMPIAAAHSDWQQFDMVWPAGGPWTSVREEQ
jgi:hypothetical protein